MGSLTTAYVYGLALSAVTTPIGAMYVWRRLPNVWIRLLLILVALWSALAFGFVVVPSDSIAWTFVRLRGSILAVIAPVAALFALDLTRNSASLSASRLVGLLAIPAISLLGIWTPWGWVYRELRFAPDIPYRIVQSLDYGFWLPVMSFYAYTVIATATTLVVASAVRALEPYRIRTLALVVLVLVPMAAQLTAGFMQRLGMLHVDLTAATAWITVPAWIILARRYGESGLHPIIRDRLLDAMRDAVVVTTSPQRIVETNPAFERLRERSDSDLTGIVFAGEDGTGPAPTLDGPARSDVAVTLDGEVRHLELVKTQLAPTTGFAGLMTVIRDVTETVELARRLEAYDEMVANDLRRPLAEALAAIDRALDESQTSEELAIEAARTSCRQALQLVNVHLRLARFRDGEQHQAKVESEVIVRTVLSQMRSTLDLSRIAVVVPHDWPPATGDPLLVEHLWREAIGHAIRGTGKDMRIDLQAERNDGVVRFTVRYRAKEATRAPAFSVIAERIIARLRGALGVRRADGEFAFWFDLPAWT